MVLPQENSQLLIVEDDPNLGFLLKQFLQSQQLNVVLCGDGESGLIAFHQRRFDLCILDIMLPKMDGFQVARAIRNQNSRVPLLFLTARTLKADQIKGFQLGADDYICKPFDEELLLCKIQAILRRNQEESFPSRFRLGNVLFDYGKQLLSIQGQEKRITAKENELLRLLCLRKNQILKREEALELIWGENDYFLGRSLDVFISKLRKYLKSAPEISIENVFGVGFILRDRSINT